MKDADIMKTNVIHFINGYGTGGGVELLFGGVRKSGHGREEGFAALHEFVRIKTVVHNHGQDRAQKEPIQGRKGSGR